MNTENAAVENDSIDVELDGAWEDGEDGLEAEKEPETEPVTKEADKEEKGAQEGEKTENPANQPETFILKNKILGARQVTKDEYDAFAQKGYDYDRVQQERDQLREYKKSADPAYTAMKEFAKRAGFGDNLPGFLDALREQELRQSGKTATEAKNIVAQEKREADLTARERAVAAKERAQTSAEQAERMAREQSEARRKGMREFMATHPDVKPENIPNEVWRQVANGVPMSAAYAMHENAQLKAQLAAERQNKINQQRSPGGLGANTGGELDELDRMWDEED